MDSLIESLLRADPNPTVARVPLPRKLPLITICSESSHYIVCVSYTVYYVVFPFLFSAEKRFAGPGCPQGGAVGAIDTDRSQEAKRRKLVIKAGPLRAGPEERVYDIVSQQTEAAAIPIVQEDTRRAASAADGSDAAVVDPSAELLSSVSDVGEIMFPLCPEPEWEKILGDLETELNMFTPPSSPPPKKVKKEEKTSLLSQLLTSQGSVREELAKIERNPGKPPAPPCLPSPPQDDSDSGFNSPSVPAGSPDGLSPLSNTPLTPDSFSSGAFPFDPQEPVPMPLSYPGYGSSVLPPYNAFEEFASPPVNAPVSDWPFQPPPEAWERQMFSAPTVYPLCQPPLDNTALLADLIPGVRDDVAIGNYLLL